MNERMVLPAPQSHSSSSAAGRQLSCQGHFWPWLPYQASTACRCVPLLGFHYTLLHYNAVLAVRWSHLAQHDRPSLAWHSSACSTVCTLYYTASRSRMVSYFDLADYAELCVGLRRINGPNFFIDIPTLCGRCLDLIITTECKGNCALCTNV